MSGTGTADGAGMAETGTVTGRGAAREADRLRSIPGASREGAMSVNERGREVAIAMTATGEVS